MVSTMKKGKVIFLLTLILAIVMSLCSCGDNPDEKAAHMNHEDVYGKGDYVYNTVTFTGSGLGKETILSVKELEELAYDEDKELGYQNVYSMLTSGSVFSAPQMTGLKLYDLLNYLGMKEGLADDTRVTLVSRDGYVIELDLAQLRSQEYSRYSSKGDEEYEETALPVLLAFGSEGTPLIGPTGSEDMGKEFTEKDGYSEEAENVGGPVRLVIGQTSSDEFNAPNCAKWISKIIIGEEESYTHHTGEQGKKEAVKISVYSEKGKQSEENYTFSDLESFADEQSANKERNYYGETDFYEGTNLWNFLTDEVKIRGREGKVKFIYSDSTEETLDLKYLRNLNGNFENYIIKKYGLEITAVKPALGYSTNGQPTKDGALYALLPENGREKTEGTFKQCAAIEVYPEDSLKTADNPYADSRISINGEGLTASDSFTVKQLEEMDDIITTSGEHRGVSLLGLLEKTGLAIDAKDVIVNNGEKTVEISLADLRKQEKDVILATRKDGEALGKKAGPIALRGKELLDNAVSLTVTAKAGQWNHLNESYDAYLDTELVISGNQAKGEKVYTLKELETLGKAYTVKDSFAAGGGKAGYQGIILKKLIEGNLKSGVRKPKAITIIGSDGYEVKISVDDVYSGVESKYQVGETRDIILAYSKDGMPLVPSKKSKGYEEGNQFGPLRLIIENQTAKWVKSVKEIRLGDD